jgi:hypothetical protein
MLRFATKPDEVFTKLIDDSLSLGVSYLRDLGPEFGYFWLDENTWKLFGESTTILQNELRKLTTANASPDLFELTDYHFRLLDRVLDWYCELYNESAEKSEEWVIYSKGREIRCFNIDTIRSDFFFDMDYELFDTLGADQSEQTKMILELMGVTKSGRNMQQGKPADIEEFALIKCEPDPNWETVDDIGDDFWFE